MYIPAGLAFNNFIVVAVLVVTLYFAREILVPIALAVLLSFVLAPLVKLLQRARLPRPVAVTSAVVVALAIAINMGTMVMVQVNQLLSDSF
jgi:predicted PurR-regulated permease PerM